MDWLSPVRRAARRAPTVRVNSPVLARYLDDLARQDQLAGEWDALAAAARGMDDALPPRGPIPPGDFNVAIEGMMPDSPPMPVADMLFGNDRTRALVNSRLDRLTPEQQVGSLGMVGRRADADAAMRRKQDIESDMDLGTRLGLATGAAALAGGFALKQQEDEEAAARQAILDAEADRLRRDERVDDFIRASVNDIQIVDDSPVEMAEVLEPVDEIAMIAGLLEDDGEMDVVMDSPEQAVDNSPGPDIPVGMNRDLEDLPGPQMRSVKALMAAGIPEGRAMAIIVKGSSMSPDEYRMVTGGRR